MSASDAYSPPRPIVAPRTPVIPATAGWVARCDGEDFAVLGWALGIAEFGDAGPIVWDSAENELAVLGAVDVFFEPVAS